MPDILAAGVVVFRPGREVLLVHRPKYDDWSFPKGKLDRGEHPVAAAVREVAEETGVHVRLGPPLPSQRYPVARRMKTVHYWTGRVVGDDDVSGYRPNDEIDGVAWVPFDEAMVRLTYEHDRTTLAAALKVRRKTRAVVVLRHGQARSRRWEKGSGVQPPTADAPWTWDDLVSNSAKLTQGGTSGFAWGLSSPVSAILSSGLAFDGTLDSIISAGCIISGSRVSASILCPNVRVHSFCDISRTILMPKTRSAGRVSKSTA